MTKLYQAGGIVERDALLARLRDAGLDAVSPARDVSRKVTESTLDLSLGGYSAVGEQGFAVFVPEDQLDAAENVLAAFLRQARLAPDTTVNYWQKYYACSLFSLTLPVLMNVFATYHLIMAIRTQGRPTRPGYFTFATLCFVASWTAAVALILSKLELI